MSVHYTAVKRFKPGYESEGYKWYAKTKNIGDINLEQLALEIQKLTSLALSEIKRLLAAIVQEIMDVLASGIEITFENFGTFRLYLKSLGSGCTFNDLHPSLVVGFETRFLIHPALQRWANAITYVRDECKTSICL